MYYGTYHIWREKSCVLTDSEENKEVKALNLVELNQIEIEIRDEFVSNSSTY